LLPEKQSAPHSGQGAERILSAAVNPALQLLKQQKSSESLLFRLVSFRFKRLEQLRLVGLRFRAVLFL